MAFSDFGKLHFLVIDDSGFTRKMMRNALTANGAISIEEAPDAVEGLKILKNADNEIDFILVDQEMPVLDGVDFTQMVRNSPAEDYSQMPIIMVSGLAEDEQIMEAREAGVTSFVAKPYASQELKIQIQFAIRDPRTLS